MKVVTWNIEWMNRWFKGNSSPEWGSKRIQDDGREVGAFTSDEAKIQAQKAANVIKAMNADIVCIQEGPSSKEEMELFVNDFLKNDSNDPLFDFLPATDGGSQKLYCLRRVGGDCVTIDFANDERTNDLAEVWDADVNGDMYLESYDFTRLPLVINASSSNGAVIRIVVLHTKSKYVRDGEIKWNSPARKQEFIVDALMARRRISAEGFRIRSYLDDLLYENLNAKLIVLGDFNDGPGRDYFERSYLTHNVTDVLLGSAFNPETIFHHPILSRVTADKLFTSRFDDYVDDVDDRPLLLDHILVSPALSHFVDDAGIEHVIFEEQIDGAGNTRLKRPSDHRPVWVSFSNL